MLLINLPGIIAVTLLASLTFATTCYDYSGNPLTSSFFNTSACDPSAATSSCCNWSDFCLSDGLCMDAGANNLLSVQGCTDPSWNSPCHNYCKGSSSSQFGNNLFPCPEGENVSGMITYCCGPNGTSCCEAGDGFSIPVGTIVLRQGELVTSTSASISPAPTTSSPIPSITKTTVTTPTSTSSATSSPSPTPSNSKSLAIGLGVGIPLGLILIVVLVFLAWEFRRYNNSRIAAFSHVHAQPEGIIDKAQMVVSNTRQELDSQNSVPGQYYQRNL